MKKDKLWKKFRSKSLSMKNKKVPKHKTYQKRKLRGIIVKIGRLVERLVSHK